MSSGFSEKKLSSLSPVFFNLAITMSAFLFSAIAPMVGKSQTSEGTEVRVLNNSASVSMPVALAILNCFHMFQSADTVESVPKRMFVSFFSLSICAVALYKKKLESGHQISASKAFA
jgi:hypothetical protein